MRDKDSVSMVSHQWLENSCQPTTMKLLFFIMGSTLVVIKEDGVCTCETALVELCTQDQSKEDGS